MSRKHADDIEWLEQHFMPSISWAIGSYWFGVIPQHNGQYAVRVVRLWRCDRAQDEGDWLGHEYPLETEGACAHEILKFLEEVSQ